MSPVQPKDTKLKTVSAILVGDMHLRDDTPVCRKDDYLEAQKKKIDFIRDLQIKYECPIFLPGDVFHHWKPSPFLLSWALDLLPEKIYAVAGNHDLPQHSMELFDRCGLCVLQSAHAIIVLPSTETENRINGFFVHGYSHNGKIKNEAKSRRRKRLCVAHIMTWKKKIPYPGCTAGNAVNVMRKLSGFDLILTGDNHTAFVVERHDQILVNPGSMMRMTIAQRKHKPRVYLWDAIHNEIEKVYLPIEVDVFADDCPQDAKERDKRIQSFVKRLSDDIDIGLSFQKNLNEFLDKNKIRQSTRDIIWEAMEDAT